MSSFRLMDFLDLHGAPATWSEPNCFKLEFFSSTNNDIEEEQSCTAFIFEPNSFSAEVHNSDPFPLQTFPTNRIVGNRLSNSILSIGIYDNGFLAYRKHVEIIDLTASPLCSGYSEATSIEVSASGIACNETSCSYFMQLYRESNIDKKTTQVMSYSLVLNIDYSDINALL